MSKAIDCLNGFMKIRRTGQHATLWVEGKDGYEPSVAAVAMTKAQVESMKRKIDGVLRHWPSLLDDAMRSLVKKAPPEISVEIPQSLIDALSGSEP